MTTFTKKAFTLIELLIVIGIIALLAVTVLLALNPAEAQKKNRDAKRVRDASNIEAILVQLIDSNATIPTSTGAIGSTTGANSSTVTGSTSQPCNSNWLTTGFTAGTDLCTYAQTIPIDPQNGLTRQYWGCPTGTPGCTVAQMANQNATAQYRVRVVGSTYEINVRQESRDNAEKLRGDGGNSNSWFEAGSDRTLLGE